MTKPQSDQPLARLRAGFKCGKTRSLDWRARQLGQVLKLIETHEAEIFAALHSDLGKADVESFASETGFVAAEVRLMLKNLRRWVRPRRVWVGIANQPGRARIAPEPLGVVLIMAPWNYPFMLTLTPLVGALAAGNAAVLKPSELAPATSAIIADLVARYLDHDAVAVVEGDGETAAALLEQRFDHIFFTGGERVARIVMHAAAEHLTPVTLELGGKSPCLIAADADIETAARRIAWGKCLNAGQTCVAPDYILAEPQVAERFAAAYADQVRRFFGPDPRNSPDYARIINARHFDRLTALLSDGEIVSGGQFDAAARYIAPTVLRAVPDDAPAMSEEIFGPILPIREVANMDDAIDFVTARPDPLALYLFSNDRGVQDKVVARTRSGSVCINDVVMQLAEPGLPFGGIGASGIGSYQGKASFERFSHLKPILTKRSFGEVRLRYPPYSARQLRWLRRFM